MSQSHRAVIGVILLVALLAFEVFNFDTTKFALSNLLGAVYFGGISWATILAIAFCAIDFAGLVYLFNPEVDAQASKEGWSLMGAWLMGATLNALMTWWAVSLTLLDHVVGNEILSRQQLLRWTPILVATFVWLTRILFISSLSMAGQMFGNALVVRSRSRSPAGPMSLEEIRRQYQASVMAARTTGSQNSAVAGVPREMATKRVGVTIQPRGDEVGAIEATRKRQTAKSEASRKRGRPAAGNKPAERPVSAASRSGRSNTSRI